MKVLVVGASRGSGAAAVQQLAEAGHLVTAFARSAAPGRSSDDVRQVSGDVMDPEALDKAMVGQDAVIVALGISDNPVKVRLLRRAGTPLDVRSRGTAAVVDAMHRAGMRRLVVQSTYGIGDTYSTLPLAAKAFFTLVIRPQVTDHERQEQVVRSSGLDWTLVRPVFLVDGDDSAAPAQVGPGDQASSLRVTRTQLARVLRDAVERPEWHGRTLSVSA
ncbi:NAD(P)-dependent oxidoreductase [Motilibacter aurantiacus]|uniref:NAD(P)-dependent oxidoreductase n=1 Tax=Motilibacter aurantiacus TaxID=2714955 RepID=UPI00140B9DEB|nr:NAD(P)-binding oxidoreductase [Motilibacter aurantiacus]NHC47576.1 NAD(P)H-binding protein [Motilibacter aurantiacus]